MALEDTALMREVEEILTKGPAPVHFAWRAKIKANDKEIEPLRVLNIDIVRDYVSSYGDAIFLEVVFGAGTFAHRIYPFRTNLTVTLFREPIGQVSQETDLSKDIETQVLRAVLVEDESSVLEGNSIVSGSADAMDLVDIKTIKFQLIDLALEQTRMQTVGTVYRNTTPADALRFTLTEVSKKIDVDDENKIEGVDFYEASNKDPQKHIVIAHGTKFTDVPGYLQEQCGGIYNCGMGFYLQKKNWYVYPLYDLKRYENSKKGLTLINIPKNRFPGVERSYRRTANQIIALVTGSTAHKDDTEELQNNKGNGTRFTDARKMLDDFATTKDNRTTVLRATNNNEYVNEQRESGLNNVQLSPRRITSNTFVESSRMSRRVGSHMQVTWENSDPGALFPGMPVKYMYAVKDQVKEVFGILIGAHHYIASQQPGLTSRRHVSSSALTIFIDRKVNFKEETSEAEAATG